MSLPNVFDDRQKFTRRLTFPEECDDHVVPEMKEIYQKIKNLKVDKININQESVETINVLDTLNVQGSIQVFPNNNIRVFFPNISHGVINFTESVIEPNHILNNKIFILINSVTLVTDSRVDGIEIVLYNNSTTPFKIYDSHGNSLIVLNPKLYNRFIYVHILNKWLVL